MSIMSNYNEASSNSSMFYKFKQSIRRYYEVAKINFKVQLIWRFDVVVNMVFTIVKFYLLIFYGKQFW